MPLHHPLPVITSLKYIHRVPLCRRYFFKKIATLCVRQFSTLSQSFLIPIGETVSTPGPRNIPIPGVSFRGSIATCAGFLVRARLLYRNKYVTGFAGVFLEVVRNHKHRLQTIHRNRYLAIVYFDGIILFASFRDFEWSIVLWL